MPAKASIFNTMKWTIWKVLKLLWVTAGIGFMIWQWLSFQAKGVAIEVMQSNAQTRVSSEKDFISFTPNRDYKTVFIFYPGAMVEPKAYAPLCRKIADSGYQVLLIKMPFRMATKGYNKPKDLGLLADKSKQYVLAGHSQGAKMAARFVFENPGLIQKLVLMGTTHPRDEDLSSNPIEAMKIYGSRDGVASAADILANKPKLPASTRYVLIEGANHAQFGYYGFQLGDDKASISRELQQQKLLEAVLSFLKTDK